MRTRLIAATVALPLAAMSLAACGSSDYSKTAPATIDKDARAALEALKSVHVEATVVENGSPVSFTLSSDTTGKCVGTVTLAGQPVNIIGVGSNVYMKAGAVFWTAHGGASASALFADKWITGFPTSEFDSFCNLSNMTKSMTSNPIANDKPKVVGTGSVNGVDVVNVQVTETSGKTTTLSISSSAPHNVVKAVSEDGKSSLVFSQFNQPVDAKAPAGAVDISKLTGSN